MNLSIVYPNAYPGRHYIEFALRNLAAQTCRDFETVIVDMAYAENKSTVEELVDSLRIDNVVHVPGCEARHAGRLVHWDLYNTGALFASSPWLMFYGAKRYIHRGLIETVLTQATDGVSMNIAQVRPGEDVTLESVGFGNQPLLPIFETDSTRFDLIESKYELGTEVQDCLYLAQTGFFSVPADLYVHTLNGYNEALLIQHWVDNEMNIRMAKVHIPVVVAHRALLRLNSKAGYGAVPVGKPICQPPNQEKCIRHLMNLRCGENIRVESAERFLHDGFEWIYCPDCKTVAIDREFDYMDYEVQSKNKRAPVNVHGVGRNLSRVAEDLKTLSLSEKIDLMKHSHTEPRYLEV